MNLKSPRVSRRAMLGLGGAVGATIAFGMPTQATSHADAYSITTWRSLPGEYLQIDGTPHLVRSVDAGYGSAFHVMVEASGLSERLMQVSHQKIGTVNLFGTVHGNTAIFTFNSSTEGK